MKNNSDTIYCFVGEKRSALAINKGWYWKDGHLAAKQLFDALLSIGLDPKQQYYTNIFEDTFYIPDNCVVVAMGNKVSKELSLRKVEHIKIVHPAARGKIRNKENYITSVTNSLESGILYG